MKQIRVDSILKYTLIGLVTLIFIFPIYWMIVTSLKPNSVIMRLPPQFLPGSPITDHYIREYPKVCVNLQTDVR